ncbi:hypothetical protein PIROE2DRAFT_59123 [Piromyces sp. E2]|nr:hypothetical protein PIROE2DRAFT_59123 [Piromyces sp. E2]|eukprot:OUM66865.1 hypothetical protein PIROE2DRAFT_59123 [Piromyces sp. E2]
MALTEAPPLIPYWFHSLESNNKHKETPNIRIEFSKNDSDNLEKAYQKLLNYEKGNGIEKPGETVDVMEDLLFEVDIPKRLLSPIYWKGKSYEVVRGTWFYATDMFKFLACDEELSKQIEEGYQQAQPWKMEPPENHHERGKTATIDFEDKRNFKLTGVGSPVGLFTILSDKCIRFFDWKNPSMEGLTTNEVLVPVVKKWFNIFHPSDPVAHRIEPLIVKKKEYEKNEGESYKPNPIPYSKGGLTGTVREFQGIQKDFTIRSMKLFGNVYNAVQAFIDPNNDKARSDESLNGEKEFDSRDLKNINLNGRLDYAIQAQILDNQYLAAIPAHSSYWNDQDTLAFVLAELYRDMSFD